MKFELIFRISIIKKGKGTKMENRIEEFTKRFPQGIDAVIITSEINRRYYTGMPSSAGTLFLTKEKSYFIIDFRYIELAKSKVKGCEVILQTYLGEQLEEIAKKHNVKTVGIESGYLSVSDYINFENMLPEVEFVFDEDVNNIIVEQRMNKSSEEVDRIVAAQRVAEASFQHILNYIKPGKTEKEVALELEMFGRKMDGIEGVSFPYIVVSGKNSSLPHGVPTNKPIENGDFITMDFGLIYDGYCSDMTRTVAVGDVSDKQKLVYETVLKANETSSAAVKAGACCRDIDKIARDIIGDAGFGDCFGHGLGHSVGLEVHEHPMFSPRCDSSLEPGMIMTIEPGIYIEGEFGCRIEDMVLVTKEGRTLLTKASKELIIL